MKGSLFTLLAPLVMSTPMLNVDIHITDDAQGSISLIRTSGSFSYASTDAVENRLHLVISRM